MVLLYFFVLHREELVTAILRTVNSWVLTTDVIMIYTLPPSGCVNTSRWELSNQNKAMIYSSAINLKLRL